MANFYRVGTALLLALTLWMWATPSHAYPATVTPPPGCTESACDPEYRYDFNGLGPWGSLSSACSGFAAAQSAYYNQPISGSVEGTQCRVTNATSGGSGFANIYTRTRDPSERILSCPGGGTLFEGSCACPAGQVDNPTHTGCVKPPDACGKLGDPVEGSGPSSQYAGAPGFSGGTMCKAGCTVYPGSSWQGADGKWYASGPLTNVGVACSMTPSSSGPGGTGTGGEPSPASDPPVQCPTGKCPGTVNGANVCMPCMSGTTESTTSSTSTVAGTGTGGDGAGSGGNGSQPNGTSSGQGTSKTECNVSKCTTTTTGTNSNPDGSTGTTSSTKTESKDDYCTKNPRSPLCVTGEFGGSCAGGAAFTCEGDAVQCAMAKEQHKRACEFFVTTTPESDLYNENKNKTGAQYTSSTLAITQADFDTSNALGVGASCVSDKVITINLGARSVSATIEFSRACPYLGWLGVLNLSLAFLLAIRIVGRG